MVTPLGSHLAKSIAPVTVSPTSITEKSGPCGTGKPSLMVKRGLAVRLPARKAAMSCPVAATKPRADMATTPRKPAPPDESEDPRAEREAKSFGPAAAPLLRLDP